ncbi:MAG: peptidoglycan DD-metalloendopeptidase family protein, partial [Rubrimonas sp.]
RIAAERDEAVTLARDHVADRTALEAKLGAAMAENAELSDTLIMLAGALDATATARDGAEAAAVEAAGALGALEAGVEEERGRQAQLLSEIERAAALSIAPLERMLNDSGVDVNRIIEQLRREQGALDGAGGLFVPLDEGAALGGPDNTAKALALRDDLERLRLLRTAADRMPFAVPVRNPRFTSGFGARRDPFNRRLARHDGLDMAGPVGTPVYAPAEGVVVFAGRQGGYGNLIRIRHSFGFETKYAHLNRIRVRPGQRVGRGERIGDMGNTGRSTGPHLHYEVHVNGRAVDPMKFIKAARHVL